MDTTLAVAGSGFLKYLGEFWDILFEDRTVLQQMHGATFETAAQLYLDILESSSSLSRKDMPLFHRKNWTAITVYESELGERLPRYDEGHQYDTGLQYDTPIDTGTFYIEAANLPGTVRLLLDSPITPSFSLANGPGFSSDGKGITLAADPFASSSHVIPVLTDGRVTDRVITLWGYCGETDVYAMWNTFGKLLTKKATSTEFYRSFVNAVFTAYLGTPTRAAVHAAYAAIYEIPVAKHYETVETILQEQDSTYVITDQSVYAIGKLAAPVCAAGDSLAPGDPISDALQIIETKPNTDVSGLAVPAVALPRHMFLAAYDGGLVFQNTLLPVTYSPDGSATFPIGGYASDVAAFWASIREWEAAEGKTIADALKNPLTGARLHEVNPMQFLVTHFLGGALFLVLLRAEAVNTELSGKVFDSTDFLHPQTFGLFVIETALEDAYTGPVHGESMIHLRLSQLTDTLQFSLGAKDTAQCTRRVLCEGATDA